MMPNVVRRSHPVALWRKMSIGAGACASVFALALGPQVATAQTPNPPDQPTGDAVTKGVHGFFDKLRDKLNVPKDRRGSKPQSQSASALPPDLEHLFAKHPYDSSQPLGFQYPRLALTVLSAPANHAMTANGTLITNKVFAGCWKMTAVVWESPASSRSVPQFSACMPDFLAPVNLPYLAYSDWWGIKGEMVTVPPEFSTGTQRTTGPKPPATPFPQGVKYLEYFQSHISMIGPAQYTYESYFWTAFLYHLDFDPTLSDDRRLWVVKYVPVEPES